MDQCRDHGAENGAKSQGYLAFGSRLEVAGSAPKERFEQTELFQVAGALSFPTPARIGGPAPGGTALSLSPAVRLKVTALACTPSPDGSNTWSLRRLGRALSLSKDTVRRILQEGGLKPHNVKYWCGKSPAPEFEEKQAAIPGLYLDPPDNALVQHPGPGSQPDDAADATRPSPAANGHI